MELFKYEDKQVRTKVINDKIYFVGKDIADILGYKDTSDALKRHVDEEDKLTGCFTDSGQNRSMYIINESGLYSLILSSKLESAKKFKKWVTSEVLPSIRKHGAYMTKDTIEQAMQNPDFLINLLTELKKEKEKINTLQETVKILQPKASYYDLVLQSTDLLSVTQIAKDYGMSAKQMNLLLANFEIQFCQRNQWLLYQKYANKGYTQSKTHDYIDNKGANHTSMHTYWTQQGRLFIYEKLKENGILPLIER